MNPAAHTARAVIELTGEPRQLIDLLEAMAPHVVYVEQDEQGERRAVRLDGAATLPPVVEPAPEPTTAEKDDAIEVCVDVIREVLSAHTEEARIRVRGDAALACQAITADERSRLFVEARERSDEAWRLVRPALRALLGFGSSSAPAVDGAA